MLLDDIKTLYEGGDQEDAFELLEAYLQEYPADLDATLLKARLCLELNRDLDFAGRVLPVLRTERPTSSEVSQLADQVEGRVRAKLAEGRKELDGHYWNDALRCFEVAVSLAPDDPAVSLAAGLALHDLDSADLSQDAGDLFRRSSGNAQGKVMEAAETYLQATVQATANGHVRLNGSAGRVLAAARTALVQRWLMAGKTQAVLDLLDSVGVPDMEALITGYLVRRTVDHIALFVRVGRFQDAAMLMAESAKHLPETAAILLLAAEVALAGDAFDDARDLFSRGVALLEAGAPETTLAMARAAWTAVTATQLTCERCGKPLDALSDECAYCAAPLEQSDLLYDLCVANAMPLVVGLHLGLAAVLVRLDATTEAREQLETAITQIPLDNAGRHDLEEALQDLITQQQVAETPPLAEVVVSEWQAADELTAGVLAGVRRVCEQDAASWLKVPFYPRRALAKALVEDGEFVLARLVLDTAFVDNPARITIVALQDRLEAEIEELIDYLLMMADEDYGTGRTQVALDTLEDALELAPGHHEALLMRGNVRAVAGLDLLALEDYHTLLAADCEPDILRNARISAAQTLAGRFAFDAARDMLAPLEGEDVEAYRAQFYRRQYGMPVVHTERVEEAVLQDTLVRVPANPIYHGYFAVKLRAVGRPWNSRGEDWATRVLTAGFEFVQVLGGLRSAVGAPVFALRIISRPDGEVFERGSLDVALLTRVSAPDEGACHDLAQSLWTTIRSILPLEQANLFTFEPVASLLELDLLLEPFKAEGVAEIVRRESPPIQAGDRYAVFPFIPGTSDMHNLFWALLRQPDPALVSIHLQPTELLPWERTTVDEVMLGQRVVSMAQMGADSDSAEHEDPISVWWQASRRAGQVQASRQLVDALGSQAYVMQVNVASSAASNPLLPEMVASALFGPAGVTNDAPYGGFEVIRATTARELAAARRNLALVDVEGWVYSNAPEGASRLRHMVTEREAAIALRWPVPGVEGVPGLPLIEARPVAPPPGLPVRGTILGQSVARVNGVPLPIMQALDDRRRHAYVVGKTGTGKSTLLKNMALQDIEAGRGVCVVDPHGDLIDDILERIPAYRQQDVVVFDPSDEDHPVGLNLLSAQTETERQRIVTEFIGLLVRMYDPGNQGIVGPRFQHNVRNAMLTAMCVEGGTLIEVMRVLTDPAYVKQILPLVTDPMVRNYWEKQIKQTSDFHKSEILDYIVSKFSRFVGDSRIRNIVGQRETTVDFRAVMDRQQILLVNLSKGRIGPESAQFLGLLLVQSLLITALSRAELPRSQRPDFFLYVDEFQNFATDLFATMLSEGRKYGIALTVANQYLTQLDPAIRDSIFGNVGSLVSFRLGTQDALALAPEMFPVFGAEDLLNLPKFTACAKLLVDGTAARPFTLETLADLRPPDPTRAATIREYSRKRYGRDVAAVNADIFSRFKQE